ncbi:hypothetical protein [Microbacterium aurantiacum]|uniref:hypothetical protein n=1 Tax=Microbacterium aurantiacum TaxID=162393 RepID=UPI000C7FC7B4|nr:hypothetical protein [Microbacterium aurantiacum]
MPALENAQTGGLSRRTILKASAWSAPVVALAVATPLAAASVAVDLRLRGYSFGDTIFGRSPDGLRGYRIAILGGYGATTVGDTPTPGANLVMTFDARIFGAPSATIDAQAATLLTTTTTGNTTTAIFSLPIAIPADGAEAEILISYGSITEDWYEDIAPSSVSILPSGGTDPTPSDNTVTLTPTYFDTFDAGVTATWTTDTIPSAAGGAAFTVYKPASVSISSLAPGELDSSGSISVHGPTSLLSTNPNVFTGVYTGITVTSAVLNGNDVLASIGAPTGNLQNGYQIPLNLAIPSGQTLTLGLDVEVDSAPREYVYPEHTSTVTFPPLFEDRDTSNNSVTAPAI